MNLISSNSNSIPWVSIKCIHCFTSVSNTSYQSSNEQIILVWFTLFSMFPFLLRNFLVCAINDLSFVYFLSRIELVTLFVGNGSSLYIFRWCSFKWYLRAKNLSQFEHLNSDSIFKAWDKWQLNDRIKIQMYQIKLSIGIGNELTDLK